MLFSEQSEDFKRQKSLSHKPILRLLPSVEIAVFYKPKGSAALGGDGFTILWQDAVTVSLLHDMSGCGEEGRRNLRPIRDSIDTIADVALHTIDESPMAQAVYSLHQALPLSTSIAMGIVRLTKNGNFRYLQLGDTSLYLSENGRSKLHHTDNPLFRPGFLHVFMKDGERLEEMFSPVERQLHKGDRILMCSDGVVDYASDIEGRKQYIAQQLGQAPTVTHVLMAINRHQLDDLKMTKGSSINDDYTLLAIELI